MITFNGIDLTAYFGQINGQNVFGVNEIGGRGPMSQETTRIAVPGRSGSYFQNRRKPERRITVRFTLRGTSPDDIRVKVDELNAILDVDEPVPIVFSDEPGKTYYGILDGEPDWNEIVYVGQGTLTFLCPDPYAYGTERTQTIAVPPATFTRNSVAYNDDGTQVAANEPRFAEVEAGNKGVLIEEGTTNIIPSASALSLSSPWTSGTLNGTYTLSVRGGSGTVDISGGYTGSVAVGSSVTFTVSSATITLSPNGGMPEFVQLEQKPYATSFIDGTRSSETLTLPTSGVLFADEGTVEVEVYVDERIKTRAESVAFFDTRDSNNNNVLCLGRTGTANQWTFHILDSNANVFRADYISDITIGLHTFAGRWKKDVVELFIDGTKVASVVRSSLDLTFASIVNIGSLGNINHVNKEISNIRISRIARPDTEIGTFEVDEHTTAYMDFEGNLVVQAPSTIENKGTAETKPVFTAYIKKDSTIIQHSFA